MTNNKIKKIVLVGHDNEGSNLLFEKITSHYPDIEFYLVVAHGLYPNKSYVASIMKILREASWEFAFLRFVELLRFRIIHQSLKKRALLKNIQAIDTQNVNSKDTLTEIARFAPDLLVSLYTMQIYKKDILDLPRYGSISSHPSLIPMYQGLEVFFWVLANQEKETGVSVFFLDEKIDSGRVIEQQRVNISSDISVTSLYYEVTEIAGDLLIKAISAIERNQINYFPPAGPSSYYPMPTKEAFKRFRQLGKKYF